MTNATPKLGRGLAALFGEVPLAGSGPIATVSTEVLAVNPFQPRQSIPENTLQELATSIANQGVLQPLLIRPDPSQAGRYQIVAGERRWRAAKLAGLVELPCLVRSMSDREASAAALVENLQRQDLNVIEEAEGFRRLLHEFELTQDDLAKAIGKSRSYVANQIRLLSLPESVVHQLRQGVLTAGHGRAALATSDPAAAAALMIDRQLSVRQAEELANKASLGRARDQVADHDASTPDLRAVERELMEHLGLTVTIRAKGKGGQLTLRYETLDQLDHIVSRLGR